MVYDSSERFYYHENCVTFRHGGKCWIRKRLIYKIPQRNCAIFPVTSLHDFELNNFNHLKKLHWFTSVADRASEISRTSCTLTLWLAINGFFIPFDASLQRLWCRGGRASFYLPRGRDGFDSSLKMKNKKRKLRLIS